MYNRVTHQGAPVELATQSALTWLSRRDQWATARRVVEGNAGHEHTIEVALQDCRYIKPPLRKDENELLCQHEPRDIAGDGPAIKGVVK
ncbi:MAG: hypothetical protein WBW81_05030 [Methylocella sp.]